jgi:tetratricopeptide (TPR) repeat protein
MELGLKQKDLEDNIISSSTISNVELGRGHISERKLAHLCEKLGWKLEDIPKHLEAERQKETDTASFFRLELKAIENDIDFVSPSAALLRLRQVKIPPDHPFQPLTVFLKGRCAYKSGNLDKATSYYREGIRLADLFPEARTMNVPAVCFHGLGQVFFRQNDPNRALEAVKQGLAVFDPDGERQYLRYHLLISKVIYLEKLERLSEAIMTLEEGLWPYLSEIETEVQLNMYELHASLLTKMGMPEKAIPFAEKGLELARRSRNMDRCFELWTTLGSSYKQLRQFDFAERCFETALRFENRVGLRGLIATNYTELGILHWMKGEPETAEAYLQKAVKVSQKAKDRFRQYEALLALGKIFLQQKKEKEAISHLEMACQVAKENGFLRQERDAYIYLSQCYENRDVVLYHKYSARVHQLSVQLLQGRDEWMSQKMHKAAGDPPDP